jgi:hypothetical protein
MDLICFDVVVDNVTFFIDCNLVVYSQSIQNSIYIDYGDCFNETVPLDMQDKIRFHFGPDINIDSASFLQSNSFMNGNEFLVLNNEFIYDAFFFGFEIYAERAGAIGLDVILFY